MLCDPPPANEAILPQVKQGSYFFNRIGQERTVIPKDCFRPLDHVIKLPVVRDCTALAEMAKIGVPASS